MHRFPCCVLLAASLLAATACNRQPPLPKCYATTGTVTYKGGKELKGGSIEFRSTDDPLLRIMSEIGSDGKFTLRTVKDQLQENGAPEGTYQVIVQPPAISDPRGGGVQTRGVEPITLTEKYKLEAKDNNLKIELPVGPP